MFLITSLYCSSYKNIKQVKNTDILFSLVYKVHNYLPKIEKKIATKSKPASRQEV